MNSGSRGFTLIEVLVALAVLAIAFGGAFQALSGGIEWLDRDRNSQRAVLLGQSLLGRVEHDIPLRDGENTGRAPGGFSWRVEMTPWGDAENTPSGRLIGYKVAVTIGWTERRQTRRLRFDTLRLALKDQGS
jgi:general secretion pathway protein I